MTVETHLHGARPEAAAEPCSGIDLAHRDPTIRPQDDLFGHVNGRWLDDYSIPADRATDGAFRELHDRAEEEVRQIIIVAGSSDPHDPDARRIGDLYSSFLDEDAVERRGVAPLLEELALIDAATGPADLAAVIGRFQRTAVGGAVGLYVDTDSKDSSRYLVHLSQSGLGLPDESYYRDEQHAAILGAYPAHIARMFACALGGFPRRVRRTGRPHRRPGDQAVAAHWDVVRRRDAEATYNLRSFADLSDTAPGFDGPRGWPRWAALRMLSPKSLCASRITSPRSLNCGPVRISRTGGTGRGGGFDPCQVVGADRRLGGRGLRLLRADSERNRADPGALEARGVAGAEPDGRRRRPTVRRPALPPEAKTSMDELVANLREAYRVSISDLSGMTRRPDCGRWRSWTSSPRRSATR